MYADLYADLIEINPANIYFTESPAHLGILKGVYRGERVVIKTIPLPPHDRLTCPLSRTVVELNPDYYKGSFLHRDGKHGCHLYADLGPDLQEQREAMERAHPHNANELVPEVLFKIMEWALGMLRCLAPLHARGYRHGDVKPENMVSRTRADHTEDVRLIDLEGVQPNGTLSRSSTPAYLYHDDPSKDSTPTDYHDRYALAICFLVLGFYTVINKLLDRATLPVLKKYKQNSYTPEIKTQCSKAVRRSLANIQIHPHHHYALLLTYARQLINDQDCRLTLADYETSILRDWQRWIEQNAPVNPALRAHIFLQDPSSATPHSGTAAADTDKTVRAEALETATSQPARPLTYGTMEGDSAHDYVRHESREEPGCCGCTIG